MPTPSIDIHAQLAQARLPAMPQVLLRLLELCEREAVGLAELAGLVDKDAAIATRVIAIANSAYYRRTQRLDSLEQCLAVLGAEALRALVLNHSILELFSRFHAAERFDLRPFWLHSLRCAVYAKRLAKHFDYTKADEAYLAGLLHDVGRLALLSVDAERYLPLWQADWGEADLLERERSLYGSDHAEIAAWLAERWHLDALCGDALRYHHEPRERVQRCHPLARIVALANLFSHVGDAAQAEALAVAWGLSVEAGLNLMTGVEEAVRLIAEQFGITLPEAEPPAALAEAQQATARLADAVADRLLASQAFADTASDKEPESARLRLAQSTQLVFGPCAVALFTPESGWLRGEALDRDGERLAEITIGLDDADSGIARAWRGESPVLPGATGHSLIDAQVRRLMRAAALMPLCLRHAGEDVGVLVLGIDAESAAALKGRTRLLPVFAREAARYLSQSQRHRQRLEAVREATAQAYVLQARKVIHEVANPLGVVRNYLAILKDQLASAGRHGQDIALLEDELRRVGRLLEGLKRPPDSANAREPEQGVDVAALIEAVLRVCGPAKAEPLGIGLEAKVEPGLPRLRGDADKLKQILINLVFNAAEASRPGGRIRVSASAWRDAQGRQSLEIEVADDGPGLPAKVLERLYEPVETHKGEGHAGLGLAIVKGLVDALDGRLHCRSGADGTTFKMVFPAYEAQSGG